MEALCLPAVHAAPGMLDETPWELAITVDDLAVELQASADVPEVRRCSLPQIGQHASGAPSDERADLALGAEHLAADPLPFDAARGDFLEQAVNDRRQRAYERAVGGGLDEHDWKVVAQRGEIAVGGQQRGPDDRVDGL